MILVGSYLAIEGISDIKSIAGMGFAVVGAYLALGYAPTKIKAGIDGFEVHSFDARKHTMPKIDVNPPRVLEPEVKIEKQKVTVR